jgi:hypothetical protein
MPVPDASGSAWKHARPALNIARAALVRFTRSRWLLATLAAVILIYFSCFRDPVSVSHFFDLASFAGALLTIGGVYLLTQSVMPPRRYLRLAPRRDYLAAVGGLTLAACALAAGLALLLALLGLLTRRFVDPVTGGTVLTATGQGMVVAGSIGLMANSALLAAVAVALTLPIGVPLPRSWTPGRDRLILRFQIILILLLAWLSLALYSYSAGAPAALTVLRLPLLPVAVCYGFAQTGVIGLTGLLALLTEAVYIAGLIAFADYGLRRRHATFAPRHTAR